MKTLDRLKLTENTLVVFCSDNGPVMDDGYKDEALEKLGSHKAAGPYKGGKYSIYEGGTRTPFIVSWKGEIPAGTSEQVVCTIDLATSLATLTGTEIPKEAFLDSLDVSGALLGKPDALGRTHLIQQDNGGKGNHGYRSGNWKLTHHAKKSARNIKVEKTLANTKVPEYQLYDLSNDPGEKVNIIKGHAKIAGKLQAELATAIANGRTRK
jgi:arylsulfatase A